MQLKVQNAYEEEYVQYSADDEDDGTHEIYAGSALLDVTFGRTVDCFFCRLLKAAK